MAIPAFDGILNVLPPHSGDPTNPSDLSPYHCTLVEVCTRFNTSPARRKILLGLLNLRAELYSLGYQGFQWLSGSFVEDIEAYAQRDPRDVDAITIAKVPGLQTVKSHIMSRPDLFVPDQTKAKYLVDHYVVSLDSPTLEILYAAKYWYALFSHRRDSVWKGMLSVDLIDKSDDDAARSILGIHP